MSSSSSTSSNPVSRRARTVGAFAAVVLAGFALTGCGGTEEAPAEAGTTARAPSDGGGSSPATGSPSSEESAEGSTSAKASSSEGGGATASASSDDDAAYENFLYRSSEPGDGDISVTVGYGIIGEPTLQKRGSTTITKADNFELMDSTSSGYIVDCEGTLELGGDPVPCTFDKDGTVLEGEAVYAPLAGSDRSIVIGHIEGSSDGDQPLYATGEEGVLASYYGHDEIGPDGVTAQGAEENLVEAYDLGSDPEGSSRADGVSADCELKDEGLTASCIPTNMGDLDGYYVGHYHPGADGRPFYVYVHAEGN